MVKKTEGSEGEEPLEIEFVKTKKFFSLLKETGLRKTEQPHSNLLNFLSMEGNIYNQGLMIKKLTFLLEQCETSDYLQSAGTYFNKGIQK